MSDAPPEHPDPRPFGEVLAELESGLIERELSSALQEIVHAVRHHARAGRLTLSIDITPVSGHMSMVNLIPDIKKKLPQIKRAPSMFFADRESRISQHHPDQLTDPALLPGKTGDHA